jgi:hypothetical protein
VDGALDLAIRDALGLEVVEKHRLLGSPRSSRRVAWNRDAARPRCVSPLRLAKPARLVIVFIWHEITQKREARLEPAFIAIDVWHWG